MAARNVIVFGPTGGVGAVVAKEARQRGAHVWLAMRDTNKSIPGIDWDAPGYTRVQADLTQPETLSAAIEKSGATAAFVYLMMGATDAMKSAFDALKSAGVEYVVFLSSYTVQGPASDAANKKNFLAMAHSQAELSLSASGMGYTAVRPAYFATNIFVAYGDVKQPKLQIMSPEAKLDYIAPADIGAVCGAILAEESLRKDMQIVYLCGPELMTQREAWTMLSCIADRPLEIEGITGAQWKEKLKGMLPDVVLDAMASTEAEPDVIMSYPEETYEEGRRNIEKFTGRKPTTWTDWVEQRKMALRP